MPMSPCDVCELRGILPTSCRGHWLKCGVCEYCADCTARYMREGKWTPHPDRKQAVEDAAQGREWIEITVDELVSEKDKLVEELKRARDYAEEMRLEAFRKSVIDEVTKERAAEAEILKVRLAGEQAQVRDLEKRERKMLDALRDAGMLDGADGNGTRVIRIDADTLPFDAKRKVEV